MTVERNSAESRSKAMTAVGFEPTQLALVELESTPLRPLGQTVLKEQVFQDRPWKPERNELGVVFDQAG